MFLMKIEDFENFPKKISILAINQAYFEEVVEEVVEKVVEEDFSEITICFQQRLMRKIL